MKELWGKLDLELEPGQRSEAAAASMLIKPGYMTDVFRGWAEADELLVAEIREKGLSMGCPEEKLQPGFQARILEFTGTDETVDRMGDIIRVEGWEFDNFRRNPVFMPWHDYKLPPVGQALDVYVDQVKVKASNKKRQRVRFVILFADEIENPLAETMFKLYKGGFMRATSVGFKPLQVKRPDDDEREELQMGPIGVIFEKQELLELSGVSVPANPSALLEAGMVIEGDDRKEIELLADKAGDVDKEFAVALRSAVEPKKKILALDGLRKESIETGLKKAAELLEEVTIERGVVPSDVSKERAEMDEEWMRPTLSDFSDKPWGDLTSPEKRKIAGHYAHADASPASGFGALRLPHHRASDGYIVFRGVVAAAGRFNQANIPPGDKPGVRRHLSAHYRAYGRTPPPVLQEAIDATIAESKMGGEYWLGLVDELEEKDFLWLSDEEELERVIAEDEAQAEKEAQEAEAALEAAKEGDPAPEPQGGDGSPGDGEGGEGDVNVATFGIDSWVDLTTTVVESLTDSALELRTATAEAHRAAVESSLSKLWKVLTASAIKISTALEVEEEAEDKDAEEVRVAVEELTKQTITLQALKFPKKIWKSAEVVKAWAEANGFVADEVTAEGGSFALTQRKATAFSDLRDFCISPGGSDPGDGCRIVATGGALKSPVELSVEGLAGAVKEGFDRLEAAVKPSAGRTNSGGDNRRGSSGSNLYAGLLDVTKTLATKVTEKE